jgi:HEAT repeat protein
LEGEERGQAEDMLLNCLPDARGVIGLGVLRSRQAEPQLLQLFEAEQQVQRESVAGDWFPYALIYLAKALWQIRPDPRWAAALIGVLASADEPIARQTAAEELHGVNDITVAHALIAALDDPEPLVRYHATRDLLAIYGLPAEAKDREHMMYRVMSNDPARRAGGKQDILAAVAGRPLAAL